jgi:uncharacterized protein YceH (UPF0502 family)
MLRGPQTSGELKQRTERMHRFAELSAVEEALDRLTERELGRWLERRPGQKEARYMHLLEKADVDGGEGDAPAAPAPTVATEPPPDGLAGEVAALRRELDALRAEVTSLRDRLA